MLAAGGTAALGGLIWTVASSVAEPPAAAGFAPVPGGGHFTFGTTF